jgi:hypothetical protein
MQNESIEEFHGRERRADERQEPDIAGSNLIMHGEI